MKASRPGSKVAAIAITTLAISLLIGIGISDAKKAISAVNSAATMSSTSRQQVAPSQRFGGEWRDPHWRPGSSQGSNSGSSQDVPGIISSFTNSTCGSCEELRNGRCVSCRALGMRCKGGRCVPRVSDNQPQPSR